MEHFHYLRLWITNTCVILNFWPTNDSSWSQICDLSHKTDADYTFPFQLVYLH
jgi:hypothetical protein